MGCKAGTDDGPASEDEHRIATVFVADLVAARKLAVAVLMAFILVDMSKDSS